MFQGDAIQLIGRRHLGNGLCGRAHHLARRANVAGRIRRQRFRQLRRLIMQKTFDAFLQLINLFRLRFVRLHLLRGGQLKFRALGAAEHALQRVIILGGNRVELMIVALRASAGQRQESTGGYIHTVIGQFRTQAVKPQPRCKAIGILQLIPGDLRLHEQIEGHVIVECLNHPIAVAERIRIRQHHVAIHAVVGISRHVQPITAPPFSILFGTQQPVHHTGKSLRAFIGNKATYFFVSGRQTRKVEIRAADQIGARSRTVGLHVILLKLGQHKPVQWRRRPLGIPHRRRLGLCNRLKGPEFALFSGDHVLALRRAGSHRGLRPKRSVLDPRRKHRNLRIRQLRLPQRHFHFFDGVFDGLNQQALFRFARHNRRPRLAAFQ